MRPANWPGTKRCSWVGSSGAALWGVRQMLPELRPGARAVTLFPDSGTRYLSTIYNDDWLHEQGLPVGREQLGLQPAKIKS